MILESASKGRIFLFGLEHNFFYHLFMSYDENHIFAFPKNPIFTKKYNA